VRFFIPSILIFDDIESLVIPPYCGPKNMKSSLNTIAYIPFIRIYMKGIFFLHVHLNLKCIWYGWEECIMMWSRMRMMSIIK